MLSPRAISSPIAWLLLATIASAQTVTPSNDTSQLSAKDENTYAVQTSQISTSQFKLEALTSDLQFSSSGDFENFGLQGDFFRLDSSNVADVTSSSIVFISCDDSFYSGLLGADYFVGQVLSGNPQPTAIVFYTETAIYCNYTGDSTYDKIFSTVGNSTGASITSDAIVVGTTTIGPDHWNDNYFPNKGGSSNNAMIILYSITGLITALFLGIIVVGAMRAHRHPERYGPRHIAGQARQSRAKGIARAMLETIPIVRFGDPAPAKAAPDADIEMNNTENHDNSQSQQQTGTIHLGDGLERVSSRGSVPVLNTAAGATEVVGAEGEIENSLGCSICTEDFVKGEDIRVLPCDHKFHPACVDPWLLNVSGTCPLCRIDLRPENTSDAENPEGGAGNTSQRSNSANGSLPAPLEPQTTSTNDAETSNQSAPTRSRTGITSFLARAIPGRLPESTAEQRMSALRNYRASNPPQVTESDTAAPSGATDATEGTEAVSNNPAITRRLRDRFHVLTRRA